MWSKRPPPTAKPIGKGGGGRRVRSDPQIDDLRLGRTIKQPEIMQFTLSCLKGPAVVQASLPWGTPRGGLGQEVPEGEDRGWPGRREELGKRHTGDNYLQHNSKNTDWL